MRICKLFIPIFIFLFNYSTIAQTVKLSGSGKGYANAELRFFLQTDPISKNLKPLFRINCDEKGFFSCQIPYKGIGIISIKTGLFCLNIHVSGGADYILRMPDFVPKPEGEEHNPFFAETRLIPEIANDSNNINNLIRIFDTEYNPVFNQVAERVSKNYGKDEIQSLIEKLNKISRSMSPAFNSGFIKYRLIMLNMMAYGIYPGRREDSIMINQVFMPDNQAYADLTEQLFTGYFKRILTGPMKDSYIRAISSSSLPELRSVINSDGKAVNSQLQDYVILMNLFNEYWGGSIPLENTISIMEALKEEGSSAYIRELSALMIEQITEILPGRIPPDFSLISSDGKRLSLKDFMGKFLVLNFAQTDIPASIAEFSILKMWCDKYSEEVSVVTILTDRDFNSALGKMKKYGFNWVFLDGSDSDILEYRYNIKMYPSFILIDTEGKIAANPAPYPSENLERIIARKTGK